MKIKKEENNSKANRAITTFFLAVFRNLLLRVFFRGQVTGDQNTAQLYAAAANIRDTSRLTDA